MTNFKSMTAAERFYRDCYERSERRLVKYNTACFLEKLWWLITGEII